MEGRNVPDLLSVQPGLLYLGRGINQNSDSRSGAVSGARSDQSNVTLDGLDNNDQTNGYAFTGVLRTTLDATEEFRVTTANPNADAGRFSGAQVNLVTKSGNSNSLDMGWAGRIHSPRLGGDFTRDLPGWELGAYAQDEYGLGPRRTLNYGLRYEITTPFSDTHNRLMTFEPGKHSAVHPTAPNGLLFRGDPGVRDTIAPIFKGDFAPRVGFAWDPSGNGRTVIRSAYGIFCISETASVFRIFHLHIEPLDALRRSAAQLRC